MTDQDEDHVRDDAGAAPTPPRRPQAPRVVLLIVYLALAGVYGVYEWNAQRVLERADQLEITGHYRTAATAYGLVVDKYPFAFAVLGARRGLDRVGSTAQDSTVVSPDAGPVRVPSPLLDARTTDPLPVIGLAGATVVFLLVFLTRIRTRRVLACAAIMCAAGTIYMALAVLVRDDFFALPRLQPTARMYRESPVLPYAAVYVSAALVCLSTLTRRGTPSTARAEAPAAPDPGWSPQSNALATGTTGAPPPAASGSVDQDAEAVAPASVVLIARVESAEPDTPGPTTSDAQRPAVADTVTPRESRTDAREGVTNRNGSTGRGLVEAIGELAMSVEGSVVWRYAVSLTVLVVAVIAGVYYGGYDAAAAAACRSARSAVDHARIVTEHPFTVAARVSARALADPAMQADRDALPSQMGADARSLGLLTMADWLGLLLAACVLVAALALRTRVQGSWARRACHALLVLSIAYAVVSVTNSVMSGAVPRWLADSLAGLDNVGFHAIAGFALALLVVLVFWPWMGATDRTAVRLGRIQPDWRPLWEIFDRIGGATWETRSLAIASRVITHAAVFAAVLWVPLNIWRRTLPPLVTQTPPDGRAAPGASLVGDALGPTIWADLAGVLILFIVAHAARTLVAAIREARAGHPPEPLIYRHMLLLPVLAMAHRLASDLAATAMAGHLATHPLVIYVGATIGLMCGIGVYYQGLVLGVNLGKTVRDARRLVVQARRWIGQPRNRLRATLHGIALVFLLILMVGANSRAPFQRLVPAFNPTRITLEGLAALVSLETRVPDAPGADAKEAAAAPWRAATPGRVIDETKASKATPVEIGVFWLAFGVGYASEILLALLLTVTYFAACVGLVAPAMLLAAAVVAVAQAIALILDTVLLVVALVTGWNPGYASTWLWGDLLGPAFDFIALHLGRVRLWGLLEGSRGFGFQFGARLVIALPSFILVGLVLVLVYRWRARKLTSSAESVGNAVAVEVKTDGAGPGETARDGLPLGAADAPASQPEPPVVVIVTRSGAGKVDGFVRP